LRVRKDFSSSRRRVSSSTNQDMRLVGRRVGDAQRPPRVSLVDLEALDRIEQAEQHLAETLDRVGAGLRDRRGQSAGFAGRSIRARASASLGEPQPPLAPVARAALLLDIFLLEQVLQHAADRLLW